MPLSADERKRVIQAHALMQRGEYEQAQQLLQGIDQQAAKSMIIRINDSERYRYSTPSTSPANRYYEQTPASNVVINNIITPPPPRRISITVQIVLFNMLICICLITLASAQAGINSGGVFLALVFLAAIYLLFQYLVWRFYWIFLAIAWTLLTIMLLLVVGAMIMNPSLRFRL
jgi:hypothetical protein